MDECTYLGHIVGNGQVRPEKGKIAAVEAFPVPKTKKDVRAFLGLTGYYRKLIPKYATLAAPLTELTRKQQPNCLAWNAECAEAFEALKRHLCTSPVLKCPDFERPFVLQTDASNWGVGAACAISGGRCMTTSIRWPISARSYYHEKGATPPSRRNAWQSS